MTLIRSIVISAAAGTAVAFGLRRFYSGSGRLADFTALAAAGGIFALFYLTGSLLTRSTEIKELLTRFNGKKSA